jgi:hypothetical protein
MAYGTDKMARPRGVAVVFFLGIRPRVTSLAALGVLLLA